MVEQQQTSGFFSDAQREWLRRRCPFLVLLVMGATLLLVPLAIIGQGARPPDDALRHCAKAVSGRAWQDVLILNPAYTFDHHHGWHALLGGLHRAGLGKEGLLAFSVVGLFIVALGLPLLMRKRSEFWLLSVALLFAIQPGAIGRFLLGRPYLLETAVTLFICLKWLPFEERKRPWREIAALFVLVTLSAWCRSTWYLYFLAPACVWLAGRRRAAWRIGAVCALGIVAGACLTLHPWLYFRESTLHLVASTGRDVPSWLLVTEFHPHGISLQVVVLVGGILAIRAFRGRWTMAAVRDVSFILMVISALLGFKAVRFWVDYGVPALLAWMCCQLEDLFATTGPVADERGWPRLALACASALVLSASSTADIGGRYSRQLLDQTLDAETDREWLPEEGGIFYSTSMNLFFSTFYQNPFAPWRYVLGFEPGMMTDRNKEIYHNIMLSRNDARFFAPWVGKMRPSDRLVIPNDGRQPQIAGLEWHNVKGAIWSGRLPAKSARTEEAMEPVSPGGAE